MEQEKPLDQQESIQLITEMIQKVKNHFHESGICAILWGSVVEIAGLVNFAELYWKFYIGFDIWLIVLAAVIPQIFISIKESKQRKMLTHTEAAMNAVWMIYGISIFALVFYLNIVPAVTRKELAIEGISLLQSNTDGSTKTFEFFIPSHGSLLLILYAIPTLASGIAYRFTPMIWGGVLTYIFFIITCFTPNAYDMLLNGLAGIFNWLIPGIILRKYYMRQKASNV
jgi:hypothetical protein